MPDRDIIVQKEWWGRIQKDGLDSGGGFGKGLSDLAVSKLDSWCPSSLISFNPFLHDLNIASTASFRDPRGTHLWNEPYVVFACSTSFPHSQLTLFQVDLPSFFLVARRAPLLVSIGRAIRVSTRMTTPASRSALLEEGGP